MTTSDLLSLLQFNNRLFVRTLPVSLGIPGQFHLLGLYQAFSAVDVFFRITGPLSVTHDGTSGVSDEWDSGITPIGPMSVEKLV